MKFLITRTPEALERARPPVRAYLAFTALMLAAEAVQRALQGALSPGGVEGLLGPAEGDRFGSVAAWEALHTGAFLYGFLLLSLGALLAACPVGRLMRHGLVAAATAGALADLLAPLVPSVLPGSHGWSALKIAGFAVATAALLAAVAVVWATFGRPGRQTGA